MIGPKFVVSSSVSEGEFDNVYAVPRGASELLDLKIRKLNNTCISTVYLLRAVWISFQVIYL